MKASWYSRPDAVPDWHAQRTVYDEETGDRVATVFLSAENANVVAAAPDLLRALIEARSLIDVTNPRAAEVHRMVDEALAKATTRANAEGDGE